MAHDPLARRGFLRGLAAAPAALVAANTLTPALAHPAASTDTTEPMSAEVAELTQLYDAAVSRTAAAVEACSDAEERLVHPPVPEALFQRSDDPLHRYIIAVQRCQGRLWYGDEDLIKRLRDWPMDGLGWKTQRRQRDEILAAYDRWQADIKAAEDAAGVTAADAEYRAAWNDQEKPIRLRILALRSTNPAALRLKVRAYLSTVPPFDWREALNEDIAKAIDAEGGPWEGAMAASILRDIVIALAPVNV